MQGRREPLRYPHAYTQISSQISAANPMPTVPLQYMYSNRRSIRKPRVDTRRGSTPTLFSLLLLVLVQPTEISTLCVFHYTALPLSYILQFCSVLTTAETNLITLVDIVQCSRATRCCRLFFERLYLSNYY